MNNKTGLRIVNDPKLNEISRRNEEIEETHKRNEKYKLLQQVCDLAELWDATINGDR